MMDDSHNDIEKNQIDSKLKGIMSQLDELKNQDSNTDQRLIAKKYQSLNERPSE